MVGIYIEQDCPVFILNIERWRWVAVDPLYLKPPHHGSHGYVLALRTRWWVVMILIT